MKLKLNTNNLEKAKDDLKKYVYDKIKEFEKAFKKTILDTESIKFLIDDIDNFKKELEQPIIRPLMDKKYLIIDTNEIKREIELISNNNLEFEQTIKQLNKLKESNLQRVGKSNIKRLEKFEEIFSGLEIAYNEKTLFNSMLQEIKTDLNYIIDYNSMENELIEKIEYFKIKLIDTTKKYIVNHYDDLSRESIFMNGYSKELKEIDELNENQIFKLNDMINHYDIKILVILNFLILVKNIRENEKKGYYKEKTEKTENIKKQRFDEKVQNKKDEFDELQKETDEQLYFRVPRLKADLLYEFREFNERYNFCKAEILKEFFKVLGYKNLPKFNKEWKSQNKERKQKVINSLNEYQEQYKNKFNLSDEEIKEYSKNYFKTISKANQYKPKK